MHIYNPLNLSDGDKISSQINCYNCQRLYQLNKLAPSYKYTNILNVEKFAKIHHAIVNLVFCFQKERNALIDDTKSLFCFLNDQEYHERYMLIKMHSPLAPAWQSHHISTETEGSQKLLEKPENNVSFHLIFHHLSISSLLGYSYIIRLVTSCMPCSLPRDTS